MRRVAPRRQVRVSGGLAPAAWHITTYSRPALKGSRLLRSRTHSGGTVGSPALSYNHTITHQHYHTPSLSHQHCHTPALSQTSIVTNQHCHKPALPYISTITHPQCHTIALSHASTVTHTSLSHQNCHTSIVIHQHCHTPKL